MKRTKTLYLLSHHIKFKTFKLLQEKMVKDTGPTPKHGDYILWQMLRDKKILLWFAEDMANDMGVGIELPKRYKNWQVNIVK